MKHGLTLKFLLKATLACLILTMAEYLFARFTLIHRFSRTDLKMVAAWIVLGIAWILYFIDRLRNRKPEKEQEPWNRKEKDPW